MKNENCFFVKTRKVSSKIMRCKTRNKVCRGLQHTDVFRPGPGGLACDVLQPFDISHRQRGGVEYALAPNLTVGGAGTLIVP